MPYPKAKIKFVLSKFIAEGYKAEEMGKFRDDAKKMADLLIAEEPYTEYKNKINVWVAEAVSQESGTDIPGENIYVNTVLNSSFYTFGTDRYLTTQLRLLLRINIVMLPVCLREEDILQKAFTDRSLIAG